MHTRDSPCMLAKQAGTRTRGCFATATGETGGRAIFAILTGDTGEVAFSRGANVGVQRCRRSTGFANGSGETCCLYIEKNK